MTESIEQLKIYKEARCNEDEVYELVKSFPGEHFYGLSNDLRRSSAAICHHIMGAHRLYSYRLKLDELAAARREAENSQKYLEDAREIVLADGSKLEEVQINALIENYAAIIKQKLSEIAS
jgi:four helix bundle protein